MSVRYELVDLEELVAISLEGRVVIWLEPDEYGMGLELVELLNHGEKEHES